MIKGSKGYYTTINGLSFVYLSGKEEKEDPNAVGSAKKFKRAHEIEAEKSIEKLVSFTIKDIENLINTCEKRSEGNCVDILLTNQWPMYIERLNNQPLEGDLNSQEFGSNLISHLAMKIRPRYHFAASQNVFFERLPYRNHQMLIEKERHLTRFLSLAKVNKSNKPKVIENLSSFYESSFFFYNCVLNFSTVLVRV